MNEVLNENGAENTLMILIANKCEKLVLGGEIYDRIGQDEGLNYAADLNADYIEISVK